MGGPSAQDEDPAGVFEGIDDPWGSGDEAEAAPECGPAAATAAPAAAGAQATADRSGPDGEASRDEGEPEPGEALGTLERRVARTEALMLERWAAARERKDEILFFSSMITCMPLPHGCHISELTRGYSAAWGLEVRREAGSWRVLAAGRGFRAGDVVERCGLLPLVRPEDDDEAICRYLSIWDPEVEWTKEYGEKLPELRAKKLEELQLHRTTALRLHRLVRLSESSVSYPLGYAHLYADAASGASAAAELVGDPAAKEARVVALRDILPSEEITLSKKPPAKPRPTRTSTEAAPAPAAEAAPAPSAEAPQENAPCSGHVAPGPSALHGRGAFAAADYPAGRVVELCPALVLDGPAALHCADYAMSFGGNCGTCSVLPLGCGALYNHAAGAGAPPPLAWAYDEELELVAYRADVAVAAGSELVIDYGAGYWGSRGVEPAH